MSVLNFDISQSRFIIHLVESIDGHLAKVMSKTQDRAQLLASLKPIDEDVYNVMTLISWSSLQRYCQQYKHFGHVISMLMDFADDIGNGNVVLD